MEHRLRGTAFQVLKRTLKARGLTYADLAERMGLSEPTVKRLFQTQDCKLSRLLEICDVLGLKAEEVMAIAGRKEAASSYLTPDAEATLASSPSLFCFFIMMRDSMSTDEIQKTFNLSRDDIFLYARDLEKMGLVRIEPGDRVILQVGQALQFRRNGPLHKLIRQINLDFLKIIFDRDDEDSLFTTVSRRMLPETARIIRRDLQELYRRITILAQQDQLMSSEKSLIAFKLTAAWGPATYTKLMSIEPYAAQNSP